MKKIFIVFLSLTFTLALLLAAISAERSLPLVVDSADILTDSEEALLTTRLNTLRAEHLIEIAIVTVRSTGEQTAMEYADDFYDFNGYGYGDGDDGALLLVDMGEREWWITTHGTATVLLDDHELYMIENAFVSELSAGNYFAAFSAFAHECDFYIENGSDDRTVSDSIGTQLLISVIIGFVVALITVLTMRSGMKTVRFAKGASNYVVRGSLNLRTQRDRYLYSTTVRTRRESSSSSRGSSHHRSSSGRSHGGRGGRF